MRSRLLALLALWIAVVAAQGDGCLAFTGCQACVMDVDYPNCGWCADDGGSCQNPGAPCTRLWDPPSRIRSQSGIAVINPTNANIFLRPFHPLNVTIVVTPQVIPLDIVITEDLSASFADDVATLRAVANYMYGNVSAVVPDSQFGMSGFLEKTHFPTGQTGNCSSSAFCLLRMSRCCNNYPFSTYLPVQNSPTAFANTLATVTNQGNNDDAENSDEGLALAASDACYAQHGWRAGARHIILMSTDAGAHWAGAGEAMHHLTRWWRDPPTCQSENNPDFPLYFGSWTEYPSIGQVKGQMLKNNIIPIFAAASQGGLNSLKRWTQTGNRMGFGYTATLYAGSTNIVQFILDAYNAVSKTIQLGVVDDVLAWTDATSPDGYFNATARTPYPFEARFISRQAQVVNPITIFVYGFGQVNIYADSLHNCSECPYNCSVNPDTGVQCSGYPCICGQCQCPAGLSGLACECIEGATCNPDCGLHGQCVCGKCQCFPGFGGPTCNCSDVPCPGGILGPCNGHGSCSCGQCTCDQNWLPPDCACGTGACPSDPILGECSGRGNCTCGQCICDQPDLWGGPACNCSLLPCPKGCAGHGECNCGVCTCYPGWRDPEDGCTCADVPCDVDPNAPPGTPLNETQCYGHGTCGCGGCDCDPLWRVVANCSCSILNCPNQCSNNGNCTCDGCQCNPGWSGPDCSCSTYPCSDKCLANNGTCVCGVCMCPQGVGATGADCDVPVNQTIIDPCSIYPDCGQCLQDHPVPCGWCDNLALCFQAADTTSCPAPLLKDCPAQPLTQAQIIAVSVGTVAGVFLIGLALIALFLLLKYLKERREWQKFEDEKNKAAWRNNANPLFKDGNITGENALYNKDTTG